MSCDPFRELISADLDGEVGDDERTVLASHLETCPRCVAFAAEAGRLHRATRVAPAAPVPDLTEAILERADAEGARARATPGRDRSRVAVLAFQYGLLVVALLMMVLAVPELFASSGTAVHTSRHLGGWDVAFAVGLVLAALQPWRARGLLPMAGALAGVMVLTAAVDIARGTTPGLAEGTHLLEVFGLAFLWLLARSVPPGERPGLRRPAPAGGSAPTSAAGRLRSLPLRFGLGVGPSPAPSASTGDGDDPVRRAA